MKVEIAIEDFFMSGLAVFALKFSSLLQFEEVHHQMLAGSIVHPDRENVIPVCPEPIRNEDEMTKNDCEQNAMKHPVIFLELWETLQWVDQKGEVKEQRHHFSWVTSSRLYESSARQIASDPELLDKIQIEA